MNLLPTYCIIWALPDVLLRCIAIVKNSDKIRVYIFTQFTIKDCVFDRQNLHGMLKLHTNHKEYSIYYYKLIYLLISNINSDVTHLCCVRRWHMIKLIDKHNRILIVTINNFDDIDINKEKQQYAICCFLCGNNRIPSYTQVARIMLLKFISSQLHIHLINTCHIQARLYVSGLLI